LTNNLLFWVDALDDSRRLRRKSNDDEDDENGECPYDDADETVEFLALTVNTINRSLNDDCRYCNTNTHSAIHQYYSVGGVLW